jgi:hypothetical protein
MLFHHDDKAPNSSKPTPKKSMDIQNPNGLHQEFILLKSNLLAFTLFLWDVVWIYGEGLVHVGQGSSSCQEGGPGAQAHGRHVHGRLVVPSPPASNHQPRQVAKLAPYHWRRRCISPTMPPWCSGAMTSCLTSPCTMSSAIAPDPLASYKSGRSLALDSTISRSYGEAHAAWFPYKILSHDQRLG